MSKLRGLSLRFKALLVLGIVLGSALGFGGGYLVGATTALGSWSGNYFTEAYGNFTSGLRLPFTTSGRVLVAGSGGAVTNYAGLIYDSTHGLSSSTWVNSTTGMKTVTIQATTGTFTNLGGATMTGNLALGGHSVTGANWFNSTSAHTTSSYSTNSAVSSLTSGRPVVSGAGGVLTSSSAALSDAFNTPESSESYTVWPDGGLYYAKNGHTGAVTYDSNFVDLMNDLTRTLRISNIGGTIQLKSGNYSASGTIYVNGGVRILGEGLGIQSTSGGNYINTVITELSDCTLFSLNGTSQYFTSFEDITLYNAKPLNINTKGIEIKNGVSDILINNCFIRAFWNNIYISGGWFIRISNTWAESAKGNNLYIQYPAISVQATNCNFSGGVGGVYLNCTNNNYFDNCIITSNSKNLQSEFRYPTSAGTYYNSFVNCDISNQAGTAAQDVVIFTYTNKTVKFEFIGCTFGQQGGGTENYIFKTFTVGTGTITTTIIGGIFFPVTTSFFFEVGGSTSAETWLMNRIQGYVTENSGPATLLSGQNHVHITHGLSYTPSVNDISISRNGPLSNCTAIWVDPATITNTEFQVFSGTTSQAKTDANILFNWQIWRK